MGTETNRDPIFDVVKFFAIFMVVFWHVVGSVCSSVTYDGLHIVDNFRVGVNMPIFFAISGYFAAPTLNAIDHVRFLRHIRSYFVPFAFVSILFAALAVPCGLTSVMGMPLYALKRFLFAGWFIWVLAACYTLTFVSCWLAQRLQVERWKVIVAACFLLFIVPHHGCLGWHHFAYTLSQIGFFLFGAFILRRWRIWQMPAIGALSLLVYVALVFAIPRFEKVGLSFYHSKDVIYAFISECRFLLSFLARQLVGCVAVVGVMWGAFVFSRIPCLPRRLATLGTTTLGVYILHQWLLERVASHWGGEWSVGKAFAFACLLFAACHLVVCVSMRIPWLRKYIWGKTS